MEEVEPPVALGLKKPSPGFILRADGSLSALNNAQIEVRSYPSLRLPFQNNLYRSAVSVKKGGKRNRLFFIFF